MKFTIDEEACIDCGACRRYCPVDCIPYLNMQHQVEVERCTGCTICFAVCPADAVLTHTDGATPDLSFTAMTRVRMATYRRGHRQLLGDH